MTDASAPTLDSRTLFDLTGRRALIVGALGAFGRVAAAALASSGADLLLVDGRADELDAWGSELSGRAAGKVDTFARLISDPDDATAMTERAVGTLGGIDILVVASGSNKAAPTVDMSVADWDSVMDTNVKVSWLACQAAGRAMIKQGAGGKIVLMSSTRGKLGHPAGYSSYVPAKHAVEGLVRTLACEWGSERINVNGLGPTVFRSALTAWMFSDEEPGRSVRAGMLSRIPLGRLAEARDLAGALLFLCAPASDFCTGQIIYVDGGYTAG